MATLLATVLALLLAAHGDSLLPPTPVSQSACVWFACLGALGAALPSILLVWRRAGRDRWGFRRPLHGRRVVGRRLTLAWVVAVQAVLMLALGWPIHLKAHVPLDLPGVAHALGLVPFAAACLVGATALSLAERRLGGARETLRTTWERTVRGLLVPIVPYVLLMGIADLQFYFPGVAERVALDPFASLAAFGLLLPPLLLLAPIALGELFPSTPLPHGPLREQLALLAQRAHVGYRQIMVWRTGARALVNACIAGFFPWTRRIFFTDGLLTLLGDQALPGVFAHELGHVRRHHFLVFVMLVVALLLGLLTAPALVTGSGWTSELVGLGIPLGVFVVTFVLLSRQFEYEADAYAARLVEDPLVIASTLGHLASLMPGTAHRGGWRHPPLARRQKRLLALAADPGVVQRWQRIGWAWRAAVCVVLLGSATLFALEQARSRARPRTDHVIETVHYLLGEHDAQAYRPGADLQRARDRLQRARALLAEVRQGASAPAEPEAAHLAELETAVAERLAAISTARGSA